MPEKKNRDRVIGQIVKLLYDEAACLWSVQDKGVLMAAIKLQLEEKPQKEKR